MPTYKILVPDIHMRDVDIEAAITGDGFEYEIFDERDAAAIPDKSWRDCDIVLMWHRMQLTASVVELLDNCRLVVRVGVGFDNVDTRACAKT